MALLHSAVTTCNRTPRKVHCRISLVGRFLLSAVAAINVAAHADTPATPTILMVTEIQDYFDACKTIEIRVVEYIYRQKLGLAYHCDTFPWVRAQQMVKLGQRDAMVTIPTVERNAYALASSLPVVTLNMRLFVSKKSLRYQHYLNIKTLDDLRSGVFIAQEGSGWAQQKIVSRQIQIEWTKSIETVFKMLAKNRGDFTVQGDLYAFPVLKELALENEIDVLPPILDKADYHLMISKRSPYTESLIQFNDALREISNDGTLARLTDSFVKERYDAAENKH